MSQTTVFVRLMKRRNSSESAREEEPTQKVTKTEDYDFDEDDMIVYSPEGSPEQFMNESFEDPVRDPEAIFIQSDSCFKTSPTLPQCQECMKDENVDKYSCRFHLFRKVEKDQGGDLKVVGFLDPHIDPTYEELHIWTDRSPSSLAIPKPIITFILRHTASLFCDLICEEIAIFNEYQHTNLNEPAVWKRSVNELREMCDVCQTTLFNFHFTCSDCGTSVCIACYKERKANFVLNKPKTKAEREERDNFFWLKCHNGIDHNLDQMILTQMIPGNAIQLLRENVHKMCDENEIEMNCACRNVSQRFKDLEHYRKTMKGVVVLRNIDKLRRPLLKPNLAADFTGYKRVRHVRISKGEIVKFLEVNESEDSYKVFQDQIQRGKPVVVANVTSNMNKTLWTPSYFHQRIGHKKHSLVDCETDRTIHRVKMENFWAGFNSFASRLPTDNEEKMVLKLKDWPTRNDFKDLMKNHFQDINQALPFKFYTSREGHYNLASYLPKHFLAPDLGPKMYTAYGQKIPARAGSTNTHLDVSDAMNVMVHVSRPLDHHLAHNQYKPALVVETMKQCGCSHEDIEAFERGGKLPGAIWYIFPASQADNIRKVLKNDAMEKGKPFEENDDPLHDQNCFIDKKLKDKLAAHGINAWTIVQWEGDAVFIPAGAPHQVLNIFDCIKVALDFVSPENITECFQLTSEFRQLSSSHANREDKLQAKNLLYHTVKNMIEKSDYDE